MIKLKNLLKESDITSSIIPKNEFNKLLNVKVGDKIILDFIRVNGVREKVDLIVSRNAYENNSYGFVGVKFKKVEPNVVNNYEIVLNKKRGGIWFRSKFGYATNRTDKKIIGIKVK